MIKLPKEVHRRLLYVGSTHPEIVEWLEDWLAHDLNQLPNVLQNTALAQGRCQVLKDVIKLFKPPANPAQSTDSGK